jgi:nucleoside-diphosphate-sugar epimerase
MAAPQLPRRFERVLVTGGSSFLGAALVQQLVADPAVSVAITSRNPVRGDNRVHLHAADITSRKEFQNVFDRHLHTT